MTTCKLGAVSLDCNDIDELIGFYSRLTGYDVLFTSEDFAAIDLGSIWLTAQHVDNYVAPTWPESTQPKQQHLEFKVLDLEEGEAHALAAGAIKSSTQPNPNSWRVMHDPAGHLFCLTTLIPD